MAFSMNRPSMDISYGGESNKQQKSNLMKDNPVAKYLKNQKQVSEWIFTILQFLVNWLPFYLQKERSYFCISIGCTGGRHRSVFCVEEVAKNLKLNWTTSIRHRNL